MISMFFFFFSFCFRIVFFLSGRLQIHPEVMELLVIILVFGFLSDKMKVRPAMLIRYCGFFFLLGSARLDVENCFLVSLSDMDIIGVDIDDGVFL